MKMRKVVRAGLAATALVACGFLCGSLQAQMPVARGPNLQVEAEQLFALANQARAEAGAPRLKWDPALAAAALQHCQRMAAEGPIAHQYRGEPELTARAAAAGAHFGLIEENVAVGPTPAAIHESWMQSPGHRTNLLNPEVDRVGVAVVNNRGVLYAVADYEKATPVLDAADVERRIAGLVAVSGVRAAGGSAEARAACASDHGMPRGADGVEAGFVMRWQDAELNHLPEALTSRLASGRYRRAAVGSCPAHSSEGSFTVYRVAVLLY